MQTHTTYGRMFSNKPAVVATAPMQESIADCPGSRIRRPGALQLLRLLWRLAPFYNLYPPPNPPPGERTSVARIARSGGV